MCTKGGFPPQKALAFAADVDRIRRKTSLLMHQQAEKSQCYLGTDHTITAHANLASFGVRGAGDILRRDSLELTFLVSAFGRVPNCGSEGRSTGLFISEGTDSVRLNRGTTEDKVEEKRKKGATDLCVL